MKTRYLLILTLLWMGLLAGCGDEPKKKAASSNQNNFNNQNNVNNLNNINNAADMGDVDTGATDASLNNNQPDLDGDDDRDDDGILNSADNCLIIANPTQADTDLDTVGDACDNCPQIANLSQVDSDVDSVGDACEEPAYDPNRDRDGDGFIDTQDSCPDDFDSNLSDPDQDGVTNTCDNCPNIANEAQVDSDADGTGDACSPVPSGPECPLTLAAGLKPALHIIVDKSGSMSAAFDGTSDVKFDSQIAAIERAASRLSADFRVGVSSFPSNGIFDTCGGDDELAMGSWSASNIINSLPSATGGGSSSGGALMDVIEENLFDDSSDPLANSRPRHVLIFADNDANDCRAETEIDAANDIASTLGATVHAIGMPSPSPEFRGIAATQTGGTFTYVTLDSQLDAAIDTALTAMAPQDSCSLALSGAPEDPNRVWILNNGSPLGRNEYTVSGQAVTLTPTACQRVTPSNLTVFAGCAPTCQPSAEVCDYEDNDCDGDVDEGCAQCSNEVCNGVDDDCDGRTDEGCPA